MKKYLTYLLLFVYILFSNVCFANVSNLYFVRNTNKNTLQPIVEKYLLNSKYEIVKSNPYLAVYKKNSAEYIIIILQNSSANMFYYFNSTNNKSIDNSIIKDLKKQNISFEQSFNQSYLNTFENQVNKILTNTENNSYTFSDNTVNNTTTVKNVNTDSNKVLKGYVGQIPKGTTFQAYLQTPVNTATANVGDNVIAILTDDWTYNGNVIAPQGSVLSGTVVKAKAARYGSRNGSVDIDFNTLQTGQKTYNISTEKIEFDVSNDGKIGKVSKNILIGAATGALLGLLIGLSCSNNKGGIGAATGAGIGAGAAIIGSTAEKGVDAEIPVYTELDITLSKSMNVVISY